MINDTQEIRSRDGARVGTKAAEAAEQHAERATNSQHDNGKAKHKHARRSIYLSTYYKHDNKKQK